MQWLPSEASVMETGGTCKQKDKSKSRRSPRYQNSALEHDSDHTHGHASIQRQDHQRKKHCKAVFANATASLCEFCKMLSMLSGRDRGFGRGALEQAAACAVANTRDTATDAQQRTGPYDFIAVLHSNFGKR